MQCGVLQLDGLIIYGGLIMEKSDRTRMWKFNVKVLTPFDVKTIQILPFPADPRTERVLNFAERVAYQK